MIELTVEKNWTDLVHVLKQHVDDVDPEEISLVDVQAAQHVADTLQKKLDALHQKHRDMRDNS